MDWDGIKVELFTVSVKVTYQSNDDRE